MLKRRRKLKLGNTPRTFIPGNAPPANPRVYERHPLSVPGDFYIQNGECIACGLPEMVAPDLIRHTDEKYYHCYWKKQPETPAEFEQAFKIFDGQEAGCHRYAGHDPKIQERIGYDQCDFPLGNVLSRNLSRIVSSTPAPSTPNQNGWLKTHLRRLFGDNKR